MVNHCHTVTNKKIVVFKGWVQPWRSLYFQAIYVQIKIYIFEKCNFQMLKKDDEEYNYTFFSEVAQPRAYKIPKKPSEFW